MALKIVKEIKSRIVNIKSDDKKLLSKIRNKIPTSIIEVELVSDKSNFKVSTTTKKEKHISSDLGLKHLVNVSEHMRVMRNTIVGVLFKKYTQLIRTGEYRHLLKEYGISNEAILKLKHKSKNKIEVSVADEDLFDELKNCKKEIGFSLEAMKTKYDVTKKYAVDYAQTLNNISSKSSNSKLLDSILALKCADRAWLCIERIMFGDGKKPKFLKQGEYPSIEAKQSNRCIILKQYKQLKQNVELKQDENSRLHISFDKFKFNLLYKEDDLFMVGTLNKIVDYMNNSTDIEKLNLDYYNNELKLISTYRVKYNRIVLRKIRGKIRIYLQICLEGEPLPKLDKEGNFRHKLGEGIVAVDVGTQSHAVVSQECIILKNLAERKPRTIKYERDVKLLSRKMTRSRIKNNPDLYNENGINKKRSEIPDNVHWVISKNYIKLSNKYSNMCRIAASSRSYAINEDVNLIRTLGDTLLTETMNFKGLQKRAKETTINIKTGKINCKKRFGKSISVRNPGEFLAQLKYIFELTGGNYTEVNTWTFKASQYDHVLDACNKKQLSKRWHELPDGTKLQRDIYSAYLMYCSNETYDKPDKIKCDKSFNKFLKLHNTCVSDIKLNKLKVMNSGITFN